MSERQIFINHFDQEKQNVQDVSKMNYLELEKYYTRIGYQYPALAAIDYITNHSQEETLSN